MNICVGNLSYDTTEASLRQAFEVCGEVTSVNVITDRYSGKPRGFTFVEMSNRDEAMATIAELNGKEVDDRTLNVNEARPAGGGDYRSGRSW
ncbi:RNA recognition motif domain-containing protein [Desulfosoma caldarium]|uniref:RNA recognition motif-containing protein n=1 Tax=Desulfosoma caldarium TaxID=610254 RepID=A0A3N1USP9_9BACT|nr:RNA-binding protein [Desulfosoma caldarium]ROQ90126.1 RNA recognition motif-containing protein [Desulfosoma caldarium]